MAISQGGTAGMAYGKQPSWDDYYAGITKAAGAKGTAAGTAGGEALKALNSIYSGATNPSTSSSSSSSSGSQTGAGTLDRIQFPSGPASQTFNLGGTGAAANLPPPVAFDAPSFAAAEAAAFNRAKDKVGESAQGALTGLRSSLGARGLLGSGVEGRQTASVFNEGQQQLGDVGRAQAIDAANQAQKNAELTYSGGITQRGQNLTAQQAANALAAQLRMADYSGQITQRGQDLAARQAAASNSLAQQTAQQQMIDRILQSLQLQLY